ncbi:hypothetical protein CAPTEDRAFT_223205 [Capitella teleta]|uniref:DUF4605 domain-containing protein n=1 Tax=Capitella teleta TaxID=283909 RepID=R7UEF8_CAPTE|nr:hypothetical protein CAPTEDRAFT_223205 [Capitella teleta]|eukprot:ELU01657.1 hypothetical protein CAPTEDRAFT_223205 [Capitella teleta]
MVRILSSGEIVPDDDARASQDGSPRAPGNAQQRPRQGQIQHGDEQQYQQQGQGQVSMFDAMNQRLADAGVPRWHLGPYAVEPIASAGFLLALVLIGFRGLLFAGLLFFVVKYSSGQASPGAVLRRPGQAFQGSMDDGGGQPPSGPPRRGGSSWSSGGQRLGR